MKGTENIIKNNDISDFLSKLEEREPTRNMMIWMQFYDSPCRKICCHSTDCGSIRCFGCKKYLSGIPPKSRFQCIECEILPPETINNPRPEICKDCFEDSSKLHNHIKWLNIDEKGIHSFSIRKVGISDVKLLIKSDFPILEKSKYDNKICAICTNDFTQDCPAVSYPGCLYFHGTPIKDKKLGLIDSNEYSHQECLMNWYSMTNRLFYCGDLLYCELCMFENDKNSWEILFNNVNNNLIEMEKMNKSMDEKIKLIKEMLAIKVNIEDFKYNTINKFIRNNLLNLHPQEWLRNIINNIYHD